MFLISGNPKSGRNVHILRLWKAAIVAATSFTEFFDDQGKNRRVHDAYYQ